MINDASTLLNDPQPQIEVFATANILVKHSRVTYRAHARCHARHDHALLSNSRLESHLAFRRIYLHELQIGCCPFADDRGVWVNESDFGIVSENLDLLFEIFRRPLIVGVELRVKLSSSDPDCRVSRGTDAFVFLGNVVQGERMRLENAFELFAVLRMTISGGSTLLAP